MSQPIIFWKDCWIYSQRKERQIMKSIIVLLKECKSATTTKICTTLNKQRIIINTNLFKLLAARVIKVEEHKVKNGVGSARIWSLANNYNKKLEKALSKDY